MNFSEKLIDFETEIKDYFLSKIKDGERFELVTEEQIAELGNELLFELPQVNSSNKYNEMVSYGIVAIERKGITINLYCSGIGENEGNSYIFSFYEITTNELCFIADYLK